MPAAYLSWMPWLPRVNWCFNDAPADRGGNHACAAQEVALRLQSVVRKEKRRRGVYQCKLKPWLAPC